MKKTFGPYSPIRKAGEFYFISGQVGVDMSTKIASEDISEQTKQIFTNMKEVLGTEDLTFDDVIKTTIFLTDMNDFSKVNDIYVSYFNEPRPVRSTVGVKDLPHVADVSIKIEIEAIAIRRSGE